jgi:hypothetical protein
MVAVREAAKRRVGARAKKKSSTVRFGARELSGLTGLSELVSRREVRRLQRLGLLKFTEQDISFSRDARDGSGATLEALCGSRPRTRPVPIPRTLLRYLARNGTRSLITTALVYAVRGLTLGRTGELKGAGTAKASWIAGLTGLSLRSVKGARRRLILLGFISKDEKSFQRKLNRDGAYFVINFGWRPEPERSRMLLVKEVDLNSTGVTRFAPPPGKSRPLFAPPCKNRKTSSYEESKNQNAQPTALKPSGVSERRREEKAEGRNPTLKNILRSDLARLSSVEALYRQAVRAGWIAASESNRLNWFGAAVRAITTEAREPVRVFVSIVKRRDWHLISHGQEERARRGINRLRDSSERGNHSRIPPIVKLRGV